jgi:hypothetical protein
MIRCASMSLHLHVAMTLIHRVAVAMIRCADAQPSHTPHSFDPPCIHTAAAPGWSLSTKYLGVDKKCRGFALNRVVELFLFEK